MILVGSSKNIYDTDSLVRLPQILNNIPQGNFSENPMG